MAAKMAAGIKLKREELDLSKTDLAKAVGVSPTAVWNWEENDSRPRKNVLREIARVLGVSHDYILTRLYFKRQFFYEQQPDQAPAETIRLAELRRATLMACPHRA